MLQHYLSRIRLHLFLVQFVVLKHRLNHIALYHLQILQHLNRLIEPIVNQRLALPLHFKLVQVSYRMLLQVVAVVDQRIELPFSFINFFVMVVARMRVLAERIVVSMRAFQRKGGFNLRVVQYYIVHSCRLERWAVVLQRFLLPPDLLISYLNYFVVY